MGDGVGWDGRLVWNVVARRSKGVDVTQVGMLQDCNIIIVVSTTVSERG